MEKEKFISTADDFEIGEAEDYRSGEDKSFSHQLLVMENMRKCINAGCKEMRPGFMGEKGYVEDTRKVFISSIRTLRSTMASDLDDTAKEELKVIDDESKELKKELLEEQYKWWEHLSPKLKSIALSQGKEIRSKFAFNHGLEWFQIWTEYQLECNYKILDILVKLTKRLDYYQEEIIEA